MLKFFSMAPEPEKRLMNILLVNIQDLSVDLEKDLIIVLYDVEIETGEVITPVIYTKREWKERYYVTPLFENIQNDAVRID
jgi:uncharacterized protein